MSDARINRLSGRVMLKESGVGIPNVLVVIYDVDPGTKPEEVIETNPIGDRLGSVLTRPDGSFELPYEDSEFQIRNSGERRPDLLMRVEAPEEPGQDGGPNILFVSRSVRQNAGKSEQYIVRIPVDQLKKAGIEPPSLLSVDNEPATIHVQRLKDAFLHSNEIVDGSLKVARDRVDAHRQRFSQSSDLLRAKLSDSMSKVASVALEPSSIVSEGDHPFDKNKDVMVKDLKDVICSTKPEKRAPMRGHISLTEEEVEKLREEADEDGTISEATLNVIRAKGEQQSPTTFLQRTDLLPLCRPKPHGTDGCLSALEDIAAPTEDVDHEEPEGPSHDTGPVTSEAIPTFVGRLLNTLTSPEEMLLTGLTPTATMDSIQRKVSQLDFPPSPADVPAFHDFYQLQIAFQHVWQELIDKGVLDIAQDAYEKIVELGGDPNRAEYKNAHPLAALSNEGRIALRAYHSSPPPTLSKKKSLLDEAKDIFFGDGDDESGSSGGDKDNRDHRSGGGSDTLPQGGTRAPPAPIGIDPDIRIPELLKELEDRLKEKYAFTIFAANAKERSVNFGILNTFRQVWTPLSYQAGALVKSIPLAPKQTQKVVVTRKVTRKRTEKELEKNLRVLKEETSQTNKAEQEITNKASAKMENYFSRVSGGDAKVAKDTTTITFKQEAQKSADDIKKAYRESVFKSAQEFTSERTTEITTEAVEELDVTETTEISNPNDEISVTYLFYELQRRYRLHERLFRVTPVVLVAQEVPAPHEIDQAWLVAHDWILKRVILDDSFLPTLETLSQTSGAQTAVDQLGVNVSMQRRIVEQLKNELTITRRLADTQLPQITAGDILEHFAAGDLKEYLSKNKALKEDIEEAADRARDLAYRLEREVTALNSITETFTKALQAHHTHLTEIARLRVHVKENILYYMQAIWRYEPPDQRFFRLFNTPIPTLRTMKRKYRIGFETALSATMISPPHMMLSRFGGRNAKTFPVESFAETTDATLEFEPLYQVADLDNLIGFKGNYMIFPLLVSNPLTDFMMDPYIDRATGELVDPSDPSGWSLDEFSDYVCCLKQQLKATEFEELTPVLKKQYERLLTMLRRNNDVLVVPTNSLFIECLPGTESLIERFKKDHRMIDVKKAQGEVREKELENIRKAARLLSGEREDPDIEKKIIIEGGNVSVNPDPDN